MSVSNCVTLGPAYFSTCDYKITATSINIQDINTGKNFIGVYSQNIFNVPVNRGLSTPTTLEIINPVNNQIIDTITDTITFSLGIINQCFTTNLTTFETTNKLSTILVGYSKVFGYLTASVNVDGSFIFTEFKNPINVAFQSNGKNYSITATSVFIQQA